MWCEISKPSPLLSCERAENAACCRCTLAATTRLESRLAMLAAMYVYGMGRTEMCGYGVVWWPMAKRSCDMCMSRLRKVKHGVIPSMGSKPSPLLTSKRAENAACCRCTWLRLPAWRSWLALLVVMCVYVWVIVKCVGIVGYGVRWPGGHVREGGVT